MKVTAKQKQCENKCPHCDGESIEWGAWDFTDNEHYIEGKCNSCGCDFREYRSYKETEWYE